MNQIFNSQSITLLISGTILSVLFCAVIMYLGQRYSIIPKESFRRQKNERIPLLGGVGIYLSVFMINLFANDLILWKVLFSALPLLVIGAWDDIREISARFKFGAQCMSALIWIATASPSEVIYSKITGSAIAGLVLTFVFIITLENAFNFLDGSDGLAAMLGLLAFIALGLSSDPLWPAALMFAAGIIGFLQFNFPPAKLYLGEVGSSLIGFSTAALATLVPMHGGSWSTFWAINFIFALPFCDLILAVTRRAAKGLAPWSPDKEHFHHKLQALGMNKKMVLFVMFFMASSAALTGHSLIQSGEPTKAVVLLALVAGGCLTFMYIAFQVAEKIWGKRISVFGRQIIEKYLPINPLRIDVKENYRCVLIDLLPYFSEIQSRGITEVDRFALDFGTWAVGVEGLVSVKLVGSYSVALIVEQPSSAAFSWKARVKSDLHKILVNHRALRNLKTNLEGLYFYDNLFSADIQRLLNLTPDLDYARKKSAG